MYVCVCASALSHARSPRARALKRLDILNDNDRMDDRESNSCLFIGFSYWV
jgi:hypothetical protein